MNYCNTQEEVWKDIEGYEGLYTISNHGRVWSHTTKRILKGYYGSNGYERAGLSKNNKAKYYSVHRLVAIAFVDNPNKLPCVNHIDEYRTNNNSNNLEWCTYKENANHGTRLERIANIIDYESVAKKNSKPILQIDKNGQVVRRWKSAKECKRETGYDDSNISKCLRGKVKTAYGYTWEYDKGIG